MCGSLNLGVKSIQVPSWVLSATEAVRKLFVHAELGTGKEFHQNRSATNASLTPLSKCSYLGQHGNAVQSDMQKKTYMLSTGHCPAAHDIHASSLDRSSVVYPTSMTNDEQQEFPMIGYLKPNLGSTFSI